MSAHSLIEKKAQVFSSLMQRQNTVLNLVQINQEQVEDNEFTQTSDFKSKDISDKKIQSVRIM
jgi:hypothetical protein